MEEIKNGQKYAGWYLWFMSLIYIGFLLCFVALVFILAASDVESSSFDSGESLFILVCMTPLFLLFGLLSIIPAVNIKKQKAWVYYLVMFNLVSGFTSILTIAPAIYIFIKWIDQDFRNYYLKPEEFNEIKK